MSAQQQKLRRIPKSTEPLPLSRETPTLRLGSMLQPAREQSRILEASDHPTAFPERDPDTAEELDAIDRIPRRRLPLFVFIAGVGLTALAAATHTHLKVLYMRFAAIPVADVNHHAIVLAPINAAAVVDRSPIGSPSPSPTFRIEKTNVEVPAEVPPLPSSVQGEISAAPEATAPRRWRHSEHPRSSPPLRGYAWSPTANALVRIQPSAPGDRDSAEVALGAHP